MHVITENENDYYFDESLLRGTVAIKYDTESLQATALNQVYYLLDVYVNNICCTLYSHTVEVIMRQLKCLHSLKLTQVIVVRS